jgi:hypothetical protein
VVLNSPKCGIQSSDEKSQTDHSEIPDEELAWDNAFSKIKEKFEKVSLTDLWNSHLAQEINNFLW